MKPIGTIPFTAFNGLMVYQIVDDKVKFKHYRPSGDRTVYSKMITAKIRYTPEGEAYFVHRGEKIFFDEVLRGGDYI